MVCVMTPMITIFVVFFACCEAAWIPCSSENQWCSFSGTTTVRFGAGDRWCAKNFTGGVMCTNAAIGCGDPVPKTTKSCEIDPTPSTPWIQCATESGTCAVGIAGEVRYGANNQYVFASLPTTGLQCSTAAFGTDPASGYIKTCSYRANPPNWVIEVTNFQTSNLRPTANGQATVGSVGIVNCGSADMTYNNNLEYQESETHTWSVTTTHTGSVSITVSASVKAPFVSSVDVSVTAEYSFSRSESKEKSITNTVTRTHGISATIPKGVKTTISMQGTSYVASVPWSGIMYQVDDSFAPINGTQQEASGFLQSARTSEYNVILRESAPSVGTC